jgi:Tol biopolymer transport system component
MFNPMLSPTPAPGSNGKIVFTRYLSDANADIFVMNPDGSNQVNITNEPNRDSSPAWSPDGTKIVFARYVNNVGGNIFVMNADGSNVTQLTSNAAQFDLELNEPMWSPDGKKIAFIVTRQGVISRIFVMNADGSNQNIIREGAYYKDLAWSPDGTRLAFVGTTLQDQLGSYAYIINADGSGKTIVAENLKNDSGPAWSPDGTKLVYAQVQNPGAINTISNLYIVSAGGGTPTRLTSTQANDFRPVWSPDGSRIAFTSDRDGVASHLFNIYTMNTDGTNQTRLTNSGADFVSDWQSLTPKVVLPPAAPTLQFDALRYRVPEGGGDPITVTRLGDLSGEASVDYATADGTASPRSNYTAVSGTFRFAAGEASKVITVPVIDNAYVEGDKTVLLTLSNPQNATLGGASTATLTITDNDTTSPSSNPIDDARFFVRMQYLDFLNREPDQGGWDFWTNLITKCTATDTKCINAQRIAVSAAFFIEQEFQDTGSFVYRFYKGSLGRQPAYAEFVSDRSKVIGGANLEASKQAFAESWTQRTEFTTKYPTTLSPSDFVDALLQTVKQTSGVDLTSQRQTYINQLSAGGTRGQVSRSVVDTAAFQAAEYNRAFVLMQYFGYLKRDPDQGGYLFWLDVLNNRVPGNFRSMVCAFITSAEYQDRFSSVRTRNDQQCAP